MKYSKGMSTKTRWGLIRDFHASSSNTHSLLLFKGRFAPIDKGGSQSVSLSPLGTDRAFVVPAASAVLWLLWPPLALGECTRNAGAHSNKPRRQVATIYRSFDRSAMFARCKDPRVHIACKEKIRDTATQVLKIIGETATGQANTKKAQFNAGIPHARLAWLGCLPLWAVGDKVQLLEVFELRGASSGDRVAHPNCNPGRFCFC